jgi:OFA family oxalate/formate antiporter-like MFS transporter
MATNPAAPNSDTTYFRWWMLLACVISMMAVANLQYAWTLFTLPLTNSLNATLSAVQIAFTLFVLTETWLVPLEGYIVDRIGARLVITIGGLFVGLSWIWSGMTHSLGGLYVAYALGGIGAGAVYGASVGTALKWFPDRRGLAAGLTAGAYGFGTALTVIPINRMIMHSGYQAAFVTWGIIQGVVVLVAAQFVRTPKPEWKPVVSKERPTRDIVRSQQSTLNFTPGEMLQTGRFWIAYLMMGLVAFGGLMVTAQLKPIAHFYHLERHIVAFGITALGLALVLDRVLNGVTRPFWGWISDHIGRYNTMAIAFGAEALAIFVLLHLVYHPIWFIVLTGLTFFAWGEIFSLFPATIGDLFGSKYATTNYGLQYTAKGVAAIFAGWGAARLMELAGSWIPIFWVAIACDLLAAILAIFWLKPVVKRAIEKERTAALGAHPAPSMAGGSD